LSKGEERELIETRGFVFCALEKVCDVLWDFFKDRNDNANIFSFNKDSHFNLYRGGGKLERVLCYHVRSELKLEEFRASFEKFY
jgi:hypothetical protein